MSQLLSVGDHVRARTPSTVPFGTLGRVHSTLISNQDLYFVQFDGYNRPTLMYVSDLDCVSEEQADECMAS
jgi:hypothetical protein